MELRAPAPTQTIGSVSKEEEKPKHGPQENHLAGSEAGPRAGPIVTSVGHAAEQERLKAPAPMGCPRKAPSTPRTRQRHGTLLGWRLAAPPRPSHTGLALRTIRWVQLGTVGTWQQPSCPCQGRLLAPLPRSGQHPPNPCPRMEGAPPATTSQQRPAPGTSRPCAPCEGQWPCRGILRLPQARHPQEGRRARDAEQGGGEVGGWGGSGRESRPWLSQLPSEPPGEVVVRLRVARQLWLETATFCLETSGPESALQESPPRTLASVSPRQGAANMEGPSCPWLRWDHPSFPAAPSPQDPREAHGCLVLTEAVRVTPAPPPDTEAGVRGRAEPPLLLPREGLPSTNSRMCRGCGLQTSLCSPTSPERGGQGSPSCPQGRGSLVLDASSQPCQALHMPTEGPGEGSGQGPAQSGGGERSPTVTYRGRAEEHCSPPTPPQEGVAGSQ